MKIEIFAIFEQHFKKLNYGKQNLPITELHLSQKLADNFHDPCAAKVVPHNYNRQEHAKDLFNL